MAALCSWLRQNKGKNIQQVLKNLDEAEIPQIYLRCFRFFRSLSGPSRNLFIDVAHGRRLNKQFISGYKSYHPLRPYNTLVYTPGKK